MFYRHWEKEYLVKKERKKERRDRIFFVVEENFKKKDIKGLKKNFNDTEEKAKERFVVKRCSRKSFSNTRLTLIRSIGEKNMDRVIQGRSVPEITAGLVGLLDVFVQRVPLVNCFSRARGELLPFSQIERRLFDGKIRSNTMTLT